MKKKIESLLCVWFVLMFVQLGFAAKGIPHISEGAKDKILKNLSPRFVQWYQTIYHISTEEERDVFFSLTNDSDRDIFIMTFWQQRDPTPGTSENEYKTEVEARYAHVQKFFSRASSKPGWLTDMGKFYMILGKPNSVESYDSKAGLYPVQVWYYHGDASMGLPTYFCITYFKPNGSTEWKFYNPFTDGPAALLLKTEIINEMDYEALYSKIKELAPPLLTPAFGMVPNEIGPNYHPSLRNNLILSSIISYPTRKINATYATNFLNYKGHVNTETSINFIDNSKVISVTRNDFYDFSLVNISLKPKRISLQFSEEKGQYFFNYELNVSLKQGEDFIYEYKKNFDFYIDPKNVDQLKGNGVVIHDSFPAIPGNYKLSVFAMNAVGKEFTYFDTDLKIEKQNDKPFLAQPVFGHKVENQPEGFFFTYNYNNKKLCVDTDKNFKAKEKPYMAVGIYNVNERLWKTGKILITVNGSGERTKYSKSYQIPLSQLTFNPNMNLLQQIGEEGFDPDYYEIKVQLISGLGDIIDTQIGNFSVSPNQGNIYAMESFKKVQADNPFYFYYLIACQYERVNNLTEAEKNFERSLANKTDFKEAIVHYLSTLNKLKKYPQVLVESEKLKGDTKFELEYHLIRGTAYFGMKDFKEALDSLLKANTVYNSDIRVLNLLGFTFLNMKNYPEAEKVFKASLSLDVNQELITKTLDEMKKRIQNK